MPLRNLEIPERVALRAYLNYDVDRETGCYVGRYSVASHGYAQIGWGGNAADRGGTTAHRAAWVHENGQIPDGMTIDHICKNRRCVRVAHLRMLSNFENARRTAGRDWPLGECINGHPNSELHQQAGGKWVCKPCLAESRAKWEENNRERKLETQREYRRRNRDAINKRKQADRERRRQNGERVT